MARRKWRSYQGVTAFIGLPGSGKTYSLVAIACEALKQGRSVWANFAITPDAEWPGEFHRFRDMDELIVVPGATVILIDEAQNMFNARLWQEFPPGFLYRISQVRKDAIELYWSSQHEDYVDVNLRRLTANIWYCRSLLRRWFLRSLWAPQEFRKANERPRWRQLRRVRTEVACHYDTMEKVAVRRSWLLKVLELRDDPFIEVPHGASMADVLAIAERERAAIQDAGRGTGRRRRGPRSRGDAAGRGPAGTVVGGAVETDEAQEIHQPEAVGMTHKHGESNGGP